MTKTLLEWVSLGKNKDSVKRAVASDCTCKTRKKTTNSCIFAFLKFSSESKFRNSSLKVNVKEPEQVVFRKSCRQQRCMKVLKYLSKIFLIGCFVLLLTVFARSTSQATKSTCTQPAQYSSLAIRLRSCNQFHARSRQ